MPVAIKLLQPAQHRRMPFELFTDLQQFNSARSFVARELRVEVNIFDMLHREYPQGSCGACVVRPLGVVRWPGEWHEDAETRKQMWWQPTYGLILPAYELGSVYTLLKGICQNGADPGVAHRFLSYRNMSRELVTLLRELRKIHTIPGGGKGLQVQDISAKNLLCEDDPEGSGVRLTLTDPSMALPPHLIQKAPWLNSVGTWVFGSSKARNRSFDPNTDLYSLCSCFADIWAVAEGAPMLPSEVVSLARLHNMRDREQAVQLMRTIMVESLRVKHSGGGELCIARSATHRWRGWAPGPSCWASGTTSAASTGRRMGCPACDPARSRCCRCSSAGRKLWSWQRSCPQT